MVRDHGNHNSRHLDRVVYMAIYGIDIMYDIYVYGVPAFDNISIHSISTRNQRKYIELSFYVILYMFCGFDDTYCSILLLPCSR